VLNMCDRFEDDYKVCSWRVKVKSGIICADNNTTYLGLTA